MGRAGIRAAYATGRGRITVRARAELEEETNGRFSIVVTEIPYQVNKARLIESIATLVKEKRIDGISNVEDHSDRQGMRIVITVKRDASPQIVPVSYTHRILRGDKVEPRRAFIEKNAKYVQKMCIRDRVWMVQ